MVYRWTPPAEHILKREREVSEQTRPSAKGSILLRYKGEDYVPSQTLPAYSAGWQEVQQFFARLMIERQLPVDQARELASHWTRYGGLELQIHRLGTYEACFGLKDGLVIYNDVHKLVVKESKQRFRERKEEEMRIWKSNLCTKLAQVAFIMWGVLAFVATLCDAKPLRR